MLKYTIKRIVLAIITAFIILTLTFFLVKALPPRTVISPDKNVVYAFYCDQVNLGYFIDSNVLNPKLGTLLKSFEAGEFDENAHYFYVKPVIEQYFTWLGNVVTKWDWGRSEYIKPNASAIAIIAGRMGPSLSLNIISVLFSIPIGVGLGILAGLKKNTWIDHTLSTLVMIFISVPSFVLISLLLFGFAFQTGWLPSRWPDASASTLMKIEGYIIPVLALSFGPICSFTRYVRAELCEVMSSEYLLLARTKGLTKNQAIVRHALRNAFVPILPMIISMFLSVFGGSMILEKLYGIPGIGSLYIESLNQNAPDYSVLMVDMAIFTTFGLLAGVLLDLSYGFIDPRIRMGAKK